MKAILSVAREWLVSDDGASTIEYALMLALIVVACVLAIGQLGASSSKTYSNVGTELAVKS